MVVRPIALCRKPRIGIENRQQAITPDFLCICFRSSFPDGVMGRYRALFWTR
jgi:hypothetical protein